MTPKDYLNIAFCAMDRVKLDGTGRATREYVTAASMYAKYVTIWNQLNSQANP